MTAALEKMYSMDEIERKDFFVVSSREVGSGIHIDPWNKADNHILAKTSLRRPRDVTFTTHLVFNGQIVLIFRIYAYVVKSFRWPTKRSPM